MYQTFIKRIQEVVRNTPVNTGIFTASYEVSRSLMAEGLQDALEKPLFFERRGMTSKANEKLVEEFKEHALTGGAVFLGVQGGRTSEGVDFPGNQMNSVVIIGVPYAEPTPRVKAQIDYYEKRFPTRRTRIRLRAASNEESLPMRRTTSQNLRGQRRHRLPGLLASQAATAKTSFPPG